MTNIYVRPDDLSFNILLTGEDFMTSVNRIKGLVVGQFGNTIPLSCVDDEGTAKDLAAYTAVIVRAISPDAQTTREWTGAFVSASGGTLTFTPDSTDYLNMDGEWEAQSQFSDSTGNVLALTVPFILDVDKQI